MHFPDVKKSIIRQSSTKWKEMNSSSSQQIENPVVTGEDEKGIIDILKSMGIDQFDPMVPAALNEYARRKNNLDLTPRLFAHFPCSRICC